MGGGKKKKSKKRLSKKMKGEMAKDTGSAPEGLKEAMASGFEGKTGGY